MERGGADGPVQAYVAQAVPCFEALRAIATREGALLLGDALAGTRAGLDRPFHFQLRAVLAEARDELRALTPGTRGAHHHHHLVRAWQRLADAADALEARRRGRIAAADPLPILRSACAELDRVASLLPGFETIDLAQSCCGELLAATGGEGASRDG